MTRGIGPITVLLACLVLCACTRQVTTVVSDIPSRATKGLPKTSTNLAGLELVTWHVDETIGIDDTLVRFANGDDQATAFKSLDRNAVKIVRLREDQLPELIDALGGVNASMSTWCGQVTDWKPIRDIRFKRNLVKIDGTTTLLDGGRLALAARAWVEPTLDGARMHLEFVPRFQADRGRYASLIKRVPPKLLVFEQLSEHADLLPGEVLLVTCDSLPVKPEPDPVEPAVGDDPDPDDDPALDTPVPGTRTIVGSLALGHALFTIGGEAPERIILILTPRIPPGSIPGETSRRAGTDTENRS
ncbi:MAG: hypothetical protein P8J45_12000 [Phycisphaerales bacterium]|jgi:hypothetical protein|nr:hypothetical protein [Phycisphaerales bacterium]